MQIIFFALRCVEKKKKATFSRKKKKKKRNFAPYMEFVKTYQEMYRVNCPVPNFYTNINKINFSHSSSETVPKQNLPAADTTNAT